MSGVVFLFPGQGSQYVGMGKVFHDARASARRLFEEASDITGKDLRTLCFEGPANVLVQTDHVQPAITLVSLICLQVLREEGIDPVAVAGHSVGEYAALCAADAISFSDAIRLVQIRGAAMKTEAERHPGAMAAVFGLSADALAAVCEAAAPGAVQIANHNTPSQIVVTGTADGVQAAIKAAKAAGAKLTVPLNVSGPWHSRFMSGAQEPLRQALENTTIAAPRVETVANLTAKPYGADPSEIRHALVDQIVSPVLWSQSISALVGRGFDTFIEVGPGRVLSGLMKELNRQAKVFNVQDADGLTKLHAAAQV